MKESENIKPSAGEQALSWLSWLLHIPVETLDYSKALGSDLKPSPDSFYGKDTLEVIISDVRDVENSLKEEVLMNKSVFTVGDFCRLVESLQNVDPERCRRMLKSWKRIMMFDQKPKWRRLVFKITGF